MKRIVRFEEGVETRHLDCLVKRLVHPKITGSVNLGVSIAVVEPGEEIRIHRHHFEEAYFVVSGIGRMRVEDDEFPVAAWDSVYIPSNAEHWTMNTGSERLVLVCALSPPPEM